MALVEFPAVCAFTVSLLARCSFHVCRVGHDWSVQNVQYVAVAS